jgi:hypothetical protein
MSCVHDADCPGFAACGEGACGASCYDGPDAGAAPDNCQYNWPYTCGAAGAPTDAPCVDVRSIPVSVPPSLGHIGLTLYYEVFPTPSDLLFGVPLPTLVMRFALDNINFRDASPLLNECKEGLRHLLRAAETLLPGLSELSPFAPCGDVNNDGTPDRSLSCVLPDAYLSVEYFDDLGYLVAMDKMQVMISTHSVELFGGVLVNAGISVDLDVKLVDLVLETCSETKPCTRGLTCSFGICKRILYLSGSLSSDGLKLEGRASPVNL